MADFSTPFRIFVHNLIHKERVNMRDLTLRIVRDRYQSYIGAVSFTKDEKVIMKNIVLEELEKQMDQQDDSTDVKDENENVRNKTATETGTQQAGETSSLGRQNKKIGANKKVGANKTKILKGQDNSESDSSRRGRGKKKRLSAEQVVNYFEESSNDEEKVPHAESEPETVTPKKISTPSKVTFSTPSPSVRNSTPKSSTKKRSTPRTKRLATWRQKPKQSLTPEQIMAKLDESMSVGSDMSDVEEGEAEGDGTLVIDMGPEPDKVSEPEGSGSESVAEDEDSFMELLPVKRKRRSLESDEDSVDFGAVPNTPTPRKKRKLDSESESSPQVKMPNRSANFKSPVNKKKTPKKLVESGDEMSSTSSFVCVSSPGKPGSHSLKLKIMKSDKSDMSSEDVSKVRKGRFVNSSQSENDFGMSRTLPRRGKNVSYTESDSESDSSAVQSSPRQKSKRVTPKRIKNSISQTNNKEKSKNTPVKQSVVGEDSDDDSDLPELGEDSKVCRPCHVVLCPITPTLTRTGYTANKSNKSCGKVGKGMKGGKRLGQVRGRKVRAKVECLSVDSSDDETLLLLRNKNDTKCSRKIYKAKSENRLKDVKKENELGGNGTSDDEPLSLKRGRKTHSEVDSSMSSEIDQSDEPLSVVRKKSHRNKVRNTAITSNHKASSGEDSSSDEEPLTFFRGRGKKFKSQKNKLIKKRGRFDESSFAESDVPLSRVANKKPTCGERSESGSDGETLEVLRRKTGQKIVETSFAESDVPWSRVAKRKPTRGRERSESGSDGETFEVLRRKTGQKIVETSFGESDVPLSTVAKKKPIQAAESASESSSDEETFEVPRRKAGRKTCTTIESSFCESDVPLSKVVAKKNVEAESVSDSIMTSSESDGEIQHVLRRRKTGQKTCQKTRATVESSFCESDVPLSKVAGKKNEEAESESSSESDGEMRPALRRKKNRKAHPAIESSLCESDAPLSKVAGRKQTSAAISDGETRKTPRKKSRKTCPAIESSFCESDAPLSKVGGKKQTSTAISDGETRKTARRKKNRKACPAIESSFCESDAPLSKVVGKKQASTVGESESDSTSDGETLAMMKRSRPKKWQAVDSSLQSDAPLAELAGGSRCPKDVEDTSRSSNPDVPLSKLAKSKLSTSCKNTSGKLQAFEDSAVCSSPHVALVRLREIQTTPSKMAGRLQVLDEDSAVCSSPDVPLVRLRRIKTTPSKMAGRLQALDEDSAVCSSPDVLLVRLRRIKTTPSKMAGRVQDLDEDSAVCSSPDVPLAKLTDLSTPVSKSISRLKMSDWDSAVCSSPDVQLVKLAERKTSTPLSKTMKSKRILSKGENIAADVARKMPPGQLLADSSVYSSPDVPLAKLRKRKSVSSSGHGPEDGTGYSSPDVPLAKLTKRKSAPSMSKQKNWTPEKSVRKTPHGQVFEDSLVCSSPDIPIAKLMKRISEPSMAKQNTSAEKVTRKTPDVEAFEDSVVCSSPDTSIPLAKLTTRKSVPTLSKENNSTPKKFARKTPHSQDLEDSVACSSPDVPLAKLAKGKSRPASVSKEPIGVDSDEELDMNTTIERKQTSREKTENGVVEKKGHSVSFADSDDEPLLGLKAVPKTPSKSDSDVSSLDSSDCENIPLKQYKEVEKAKKKKGKSSPGKKKKGSDESHERYYKSLIKISRTAGIGLNYRAMTDMSVERKIDFVKNSLKNAGMTGRPSLEKAEKLKLKREAAELGCGNIINTESGRSKRSTRSLSHPTRPAHKPQSPAKMKFSRLRDIIDSEESD